MVAHLVPVLAIVTGVSTFAICVGAVLADNIYVGGIPWPYLSDTGREGTSYTIFAVGLSVTAVLIAASDVLYWHATYGEDASEVSVAGALKLALGCPSPGGCCSPSATALVATKLFCLSSVALTLLACFSTIVYPDVHQYSAYAFFLLQVVGIALLTSASNRPAARREMTRSVRRATLARNVLAAIFFVAVVIYLPIGLAVNCEWSRLSVDDCVRTQRLGEAYCEARRLPGDSSQTTLWDYSGCPRTNTMRSVSQFICVIAILLFHGTFTIDLRRDAESISDEDLEVPSQARKLPTMFGM
ncbi:hypothetical protein KFE25_000824 [Diacronema lutheri]|uniref:CWH43-like N-terminal domain-containing protein n=1 Tax=Diacronema lutheri TaxID=2081491 RepID=A0A8J5XHM7_DIALT|nr:hypothetical protein KFE25_000824 [Diacronema lutheri]